MVQGIVSLRRQNAFNLAPANYVFGCETIAERELVAVEPPKPFRALSKPQTVMTLSASLDADIVPHFAKSGSLRLGVTVVITASFSA